MSSVFHLRWRTGTRGGGQSAAASAAYALRLGKYARADLDRCLFAESGNMPNWAAGPRQRLEYWRAADLHERANGRLFKSATLSLPRGLNHAQHVALVRNYCHLIARTSIGEPLPFVFAIHEGRTSNPHAHCLLSERVQDGYSRTPATWFARAAPRGKKPEDGGARKTSDLKPRDWIFTTRELFARVTNEALAEAGLPHRVDHRSLAERGIDRAPSAHLDPADEARLLRAKHSRRAEDFTEERAARGLIVKLQHEAGQVAAELAHLRTSETSAGLSGGTAALLANARRDPSREKSKSKTKGVEYDTPSIR